MLLLGLSFSFLSLVTGYVLGRIRGRNRALSIMDKTFEETFNERINREFSDRIDFYNQAIYDVQEVVPELCQDDGLLEPTFFLNEIEKMMKQRP